MLRIPGRFVIPYNLYVIPGKIAVLKGLTAAPKYRSASVAVLETSPFTHYYEGMIAVCPVQLVFFGNKRFSSVVPDFTHFAVSPISAHSSLLLIRINNLSLFLRYFRWVRTRGGCTRSMNAVLV